MLKDQWVFWVALLLTFLIAIVSLVVSILSRQRPVSSDVHRTITTTDATTSLSVAAGKMLHQDMLRVINDAEHTVSVLGSIVDVVSQKGANSKSEKVQPSVRSGRIATDERIPSTVTIWDHDASGTRTFLLAVNLVSTSTGTCSGSVDVDLRPFMGGPVPTLQGGVVYHGNASDSSWVEASNDGGVLSLTSPGGGSVTSLGSPFRLTCLLTSRTDYDHDESKNVHGEGKTTTSH